MKVEILEALSDNLMYLIIDEQHNIALAVDPVEPEKILEKASELDVQIVAVLTTHHHWDHAGGNLKLLDAIPGIDIYGGDERIDGISRIVSHEMVLEKGTLRIKCLRTPCHTTGHVCYYITDTVSSGGAIFTGDTLFIAGCGRFFEGTPQEMVSALLEKLGLLPNETLVYCGHEYTVNNLKFAITVEPRNEHIAKKMAWAQEKRRNNEVTVPSTIGEEKLYNPFMRVSEQSVQSKVGKTDIVETMRVLRNMKNDFRQ